GAASSTTTTTAAPAETTTDTDEPAAAEPSETEAETGGADTGGAATGDADGGAEAQPGQEDGPDRSMHGPAEIAFLEQIDAVGCRIRTRWRRSTPATSPAPSWSGDSPTARPSTTSSAICAPTPGRPGRWPGPG